MQIFLINLFSGHFEFSGMVFNYLLLGRDKYILHRSFQYLADFSFWPGRFRNIIALTFILLLTRLSSLISSLVSCLLSLVSYLSSLVSRLVSRLSSLISRLLSLVSRLSSLVYHLSSIVSRLSSLFSRLSSLVSLLSSFYSLISSPSLRHKNTNALLILKVLEIIFCLVQNI
jgi:hypothetical protein